VFYFYYSFNDIDGKLECIALNDWMILKKELGKNVEGGGHGLMQGWRTYDTRVT
jgi:hypothetical protein